MTGLVASKRIDRLIREIRGERVMLDSDLASLYSVETRGLNQAVKRNRGRFPPDFMFRLTAEEFDELRLQSGASALRSQIVTLKLGRGQHRKYLPLAFTEQGVAMLSSVLRSERAIKVNVEIMRTFVRLRRWAVTHSDLARRLRRARVQVRRSVQGCVRRHPAAHGAAAGEAKAENRIRQHSFLASFAVSVAIPVTDAFRSTEIGDLPATWRLRTVGDLFELQQGKALSPAARTGVNPRPFLRTANVLWGRIDRTTVDQMDFTEDEMERLALRPGDLLVCEGGEIGRTAIWNLDVDDYFFQNHLHRLRRKSDEVEPSFVMYWMQAAFLRLGLYGGVGNRTTIPNLSGTRLKQLLLPTPPRPERTRSRSA